jgi:hypothetical protein
MKKFTQWVETIRQAEINEASELQKSYQDYFKRKLEKFGVNSPAELNEEDKKKFFSEITNEWEKGKGLKDGVTEGIAFGEEVNEKEVNEEDVNNAKEFRDFAMNKLKKVHGDDFDEAKAEKVIKGLSDEAEKSGDWGAAIGQLNKA